MPFGIYFHIPYCLSKCRYCDFYSRPASRQVPEEYVQALLDRLAQFPRDRAHTVYFGGGTPSLLSPGQLERLIKAADPLDGAEITLEANPETLTLDLLRDFRAAGANRLSLGVQTASDQSLRTLGRPHTARESRLAFEMARAAGFDNISGDIMLALPGYSRAEFDDTLALIKGGGARHISAYLLKIEPGTPFGRRPPAGLPDEDEAADFYLYAVEQLENAGYRQYEISNFAKPGWQSSHNMIYWNCHDYLGLGPAAHSCIDGVRYAFGPDTDAFIAGAPWEVTGDCTWEDYVMLQLRLRTGLDLGLLRKKFGMEFSPAKLAFLEKCEKNGFLILEQDRVRLLPRGLLVENAILGELLD